MRVAISAKSGYLDNILLSVSVLLSVSTPFYVWADPRLLVPFLFPVFGGLLLMVVGRFTLTTILTLASLFLYTCIIVIANGFESVRLGVVSAIFLGLMFSRARVLPSFLWLSVLCIFYALYMFTEGFQTIDWQKHVAENMSLNYFSEALCYVLIATILADNRRRASAIVFTILALSVVASIFVASRQMALVAGFAAMYLLSLGRRAWGSIGLAGLAAAAIGYFFDYGDLAVVQKLAGLGVETSRTRIYDCYIKNLSPIDLLIGSDHTVSGSCAEAIVMVKYLHSGYLETINQLGLLGVIMIGLYPVAVVFFAYRRNYSMALVLTLAALYQLVEAGFIWIYFMVLFTCIEELFNSRSRLPGEFGARPPIKRESAP